MKLRYFEIARKLSYHSDYLPHRLGAVIVKGNKILATGFNKVKTHPLTKDKKFSTIHAELSAIINAKGEDLTKCDIYVYRETREAIPRIAPSHPCEHCFKLLTEYKFKSIYYTDYDGFKGKKL